MTGILTISNKLESRCVLDNIKNGEVFKTNRDINDKLYAKRGDQQEIRFLHKILTFIKNKEALSEHILIKGPKGSGKSSITKYILNSLKTQHDFNLDYVNCRFNYTTNKIVSNITKKNMRGVDATEELNKFWTKERSGRKSIIVLDEIDQYKSEYNDTLLYGLGDGGPFSDTTVIMITNKANKLIISEDIKSRLGYETISFTNYILEDIKSILIKTSKSGLINFDEEIICEISKLNNDNFNSDIRVGIKTLYQVFKNKTYNVKRTINLLPDIMEEEQIKIIEEVISTLSSTRDNILLKVLYSLTEKHTVPTAHILFCNNWPGSITLVHFHRLVDDLAKLDIIKTEIKRIHKSNIKWVTLVNNHSRIIEAIKREVL